MAITTKRPVASINVAEANVSKYLNQMAFKGIVLNNNPYDVDQQSLKDAKNVYVDDNGTLISRPPFVVEQLPLAYTIVNGVSYPAQILRENYLLIDMFETGKVKIYVCENGNIYDIVAVSKTTLELVRYSNVESYHLSMFEQYVILFNNLGAVVLDVNNFVTGWRPLREYAEIPVTKRVVGQETFTYPKNQFTEDYKEEYVISDDVLSLIPEGTADVEVSQAPANLKWTIENANVNTEFRVLRSLGVPVRSFDIVTTANNVNTGINVLTIARFNHVLISLDYGITFEKVSYPSNGGMLQVASVSKDGLYFFFVARDGVYRYSIGDKEWVVIRCINSSTLEQYQLDGDSINNACCFLSGDVFTFALYYLDDGVSKVDVYWKGPRLLNTTYAVETLGKTTYSNIIDPSTKLTKSARDCTTMEINIRLEDTVQIATVIAWLPGLSEETSCFITMRGTKTGNPALQVTTLSKRYGSIQSFEHLSAHPTTSGILFGGVRVNVLTVDNNEWYNTIMIVGMEDSTPTPYLTFEYLEVIAETNDFGAPFDLSTGYIIDKLITTVDGNASLPSELTDAVRATTVSINKYFYIMLDDVLYTNKLTINNTASLTFTRTFNVPYLNVPTISYTGVELFLGFGNVLMITDNQREGSVVSLNLPEINNNTFLSDINGLLNISTTEIALFLVDKVYIVSKVADNTFGYRYDYQITRLSVGVREGESVINTLDGKITIYPTVQGLAMMTYQLNVASTDQTVEYATNNIRPIWNEFYNAGPIKIVQVKDCVYLSNGTTTYLILDLRGLTWWVMTSPFPISKILTDQVNFNIISNGLYRYDFNYEIYRDVLTRDIDWFVESQPNHFNAPVYYKNLKQLIFQLEEVDNNERTINVQILLYRKNFMLRDPETIGFKIDGYRTFVKRFNYWKINEMQWRLSSDVESSTPAQLKLNGLSIKYEISEEVRS